MTQKNNIKPKDWENWLQYEKRGICGKWKNVWNIGYFGTQLFFVQKFRFYELYQNKILNYKFEIWHFLVVYGFYFFDFFSAFGMVTAKIYAYDITFILIIHMHRCLFHDIILIEISISIKQSEHTDL